jgi:hypothetical protein
MHQRRTLSGPLIALLLLTAGCGTYRQVADRLKETNSVIQRAGNAIARDAESRERLTTNLEPLLIRTFKGILLLIALLRAGAIAKQADRFLKWKGGMLKRMAARLLARFRSSSSASES